MGYSEQDMGMVQVTKSWGKKKKTGTLGKRDFSTYAKMKPFIKQMIDRGIRSKAELKRGLTNVDITLNATNGTFLSLFANLIQGVSRRMRIGNSIFVTRIYGRWTYHSTADSGTWAVQGIRSSFVRSKAGVLTASVDAPLDVNGNKNVDHAMWDVNTVQVLHDNTCFFDTHNSANPGSGIYGCIVKEEINLKDVNKKVTFEQPDPSPDPNPAQNGFYFYCLASSIASPVNAPTVKGFIYYDFYDC